MTGQELYEDSRSVFTGMAIHLPPWDELDRETQLGWNANAADYVAKRLTDLETP